MKKFEQSLSITGKAVLNRSSKIQGLDVSRLFRWSTVPHPKLPLRSNQLERMEKYTERIHCISKDNKSVSLVQLLSKECLEVLCHRLYKVVHGLPTYDCN